MPAGRKLPWQTEWFFCVWEENHFDLWASQGKGLQDMAFLLSDVMPGQEPLLAACNGLLVGSDGGSGGFDLV